MIKRLCLLLALLLSGVAFGQSASTTIANSPFPPSFINHTYGTAPATCVVGEAYYKTGSGAGLYLCSAANTWAAAGGSIASGGTTSGCTDNALWYSVSNGLNCTNGPTYDSTNIRVTIGNGASTSAGLVLGYFGSTGVGAIGPTANGALTTTNYGMAFGANSTTIGGSGTTGQIGFRPDGSTVKMNIPSTAGQGPSITSGTAVAAGVPALQVTRTNNNALVDTGVVFTFTDTTSAASFCLLCINGGSAGTTNYFNLGKAGALTLSGLTAASGTPGSICYNTATNEITKNNALTCTVSSARFKDNMRAYTVSGLSVLARLKPTTFTYKDHPERPRLGFIAEELNAVDPRLSEHEADGTPNSIDFPAVLAVLVKSAQELQAKVGVLEAKIKALELARPKAVKPNQAIYLNTSPAVCNGSCYAMAPK